MRVGTMEGFNERMHCSTEDMATWLSACEDELDIVKENIFNDNEKEDHLGGPSPSILLCPIAECTWHSRASWVNLEVVLVNDSGVRMAGVFIVTLAHKTALMKTRLALRTLELSYWSHSFIPNESHL